MKYICDMLEKLSLAKANDNDNNDASLEEMFDDLMRSVRRRFSSGHEHATTVSTECRKEALYNLYSNEKSGHKERRRHSLAAVENTESEKNITCMDAKQQRRSEGSLMDVAKSKLSSNHRSRESVPETVARKLAERKKEIGHLTRPQTIQLMRIKYDLNKKIH